MAKRPAKAKELKTHTEGEYCVRVERYNEVAYERNQLEAKLSQALAQIAQMKRERLVLIAHLEAAKKRR